MAKLKKKKCSIKFCRNEANQGQYCYKHTKQRYKENNLERYTYNVLKNNAKRRGKDFQLTFDEFCQFLQKTEYLVGRGRTKESLHIDRIDETKGYSIDNIQVLTNSENVKKMLKVRYSERGEPEEFYVEKIIPPDMSDIPF